MRVKNINIKKTVTKAPTIYGDFWFFCFNVNGEEVLAISNKKYFRENVRLRLHSCCVTSEIFGCLKCDCSNQLEKFLTLMGKDKKNNYLLIYFLDHEGRGIGLFNKIMTIEVQRKLGLDTYEANEYFGFPVDCRDYSLSIPILKHFKLKNIILYSNNPTKIKFLREHGFKVRTHKLFTPPKSKDAVDYLYIKAIKGGHLIKPEVVKLINNLRDEQIKTRK